MARSNRPALLLLSSVLAAAAAAACEDRGPPDDVERTRTGGIGRVPALGASDDFGRAESGARGAGAGGSTGPEGAGPQGGLDTPVATPGGVPGADVGGAGIGGTGVAGTGSGVDVDGDGTRDGLGASGTGATGPDAGAGGGGTSGTGDGATDGVGTGASGAGGDNAGVGAGGIDDNGFGGIDTDRANGAPVASFVLSPQCVSQIQSVVTLTSTSSDPDGDALRCVWTIPSGVPDDAADCTLTVTFFDAAASPVVLTVEDGNGAVHSVTQDIPICGVP